MGGMLRCTIVTNVNFRHIQSLLAILARASLCMGLESVVESWVSVLKHHSSKIRNLSQERSWRTLTSPTTSLTGSRKASSAASPTSRSRCRPWGRGRRGGVPTYCSHTTSSPQ